MQENSQNGLKITNFRSKYGDFISRLFAYNHPIIAGYESAESFIRSQALTVCGGDSSILDSSGYPIRISDLKKLESRIKYILKDVTVEDSPLRNLSPELLAQLRVKTNDLRDDFRKRIKFTIDDIAIEPDESNMGMIVAKIDEIMTAYNTTEDTPCKKDSKIKNRTRAKKLIEDLIIQAREIMRMIGKDKYEKFRVQIESRYFKIISYDKLMNMNPSELAEELIPTRNSWSTTPHDWIKILIFMARNENFVNYVIDSDIDSKRTLLELIKRYALLITNGLDVEISEAEYIRRNLSKYGINIEHIQGAMECLSPFTNEKWDQFIGRIPNAPAECYQSEIDYLRPMVKEYMDGNNGNWVSNASTLVQLTSRIVDLIDIYRESETGDLCSDIILKRTKLGLATFRNPNTDLVCIEVSEGVFINIIGTKSERPEIKIVTNSPPFLLYSGSDFNQARVKLKELNVNDTKIDDIESQLAGPNNRNTLLPDRNNRYSLYAFYSMIRFLREVLPKITETTIE